MNIVRVLPGSLSWIILDGEGVCLEISRSRRGIHPPGHMFRMKQESIVCPRCELFFRDSQTIRSHALLFPRLMPPRREAARSGKRANTQVLVQKHYGGAYGSSIHAHTTMNAIRYPLLFSHGIGSLLLLGPYIR